MRHFSPGDLKKDKVNEFHTLKQKSPTVHEYWFTITQLYRYDLEMVKDIRSRMSLFVIGLGHLSRKDVCATMLIGDLDISRLIVYVQKVEKEKL